MSIIKGILQPILNPVLVGLTGVVSRLFRLNEGTTDYITIPPISLTSGFSIRFEALIDDASTTVNQMVIGKDADFRGFVRFNNGILVCNFTSASGAAIFNAIEIDDGFLTGFDISYVAATNQLTATHQDGTTETITHIVDNATFDSIGSSISGKISGIIANLEFSEAGLPVRRYTIDDNSDTIIDSVGGFDGTVINGNTSDWGSFNKTKTGWIGNNLAAPPWDSLDQELIEE